MTKTKLIELLKDEMGLPRRQIESLVSAIFDEIREALERGEPVKISGFGSLQVKTRAARRGRDPVTGRVRTLSARPSLAFRPSRLLKDKINQE